MDDDSKGRDVAVLVSGGVDSAILSVDLLRHFPRVFPIYVRFGLRWEDVELASLRRFLDSAAREGLASLTVLDEPVADVYGSHWSVSGPAVPGEETPDEAVYLPGRNLLLVSKVAVWCRLRGIERLALGCLEANPFPDSTPEFYSALEAVVNRAMEGRLRLLRPFDRLSKSQVLQRGTGLPLEHTFSCLSPISGRHCGACNKCAERRKGFREAGITDPTPYAAVSS
ncbi:7-cyano-7-deazaguanine synthase [Singulisphaera rosea]